MRTFFKVFLLMLSFIPAVFAENEPAPELNLDQATKQIIEKNHYKVLGAKTETIGGKETHVIKVLTEDGHVQNLKVDAETGKVADKPVDK